MIEILSKEAKLKEFICDSCEENFIKVDFSKTIGKSRLLIIKVDAFYNKHVPKPKPSPDCLIIQHCHDNYYNIYLVELKNIKSLKSESLSHIREKFENCLSDFMSDKFRKYFYDEQIVLKKLELLFVSEPNESRDKYSKNTRLDSLLSLPPCWFANKAYLIKHYTPSPIISDCA